MLASRLIVLAWVALGMLGCALELRIYREGRHENAEALQWMARERMWFVLLCAVGIAAVTGPVYLAAAIAAYIKAEPADPEK